MFPVVCRVPFTVSFVDFCSCSMSGRGGRGQALLDALNQSVRKPGTQNEVPGESRSQPHEPQVKLSSPQPHR